MSRDDVIGSHPVDLGECDCPTQPHERDTAEVRDRHDYASMSVLAATAVGEGEFLLRLVGDGITGWNLVTRGEKEGTLVPLPVSEYNVNRLSATQKMALLSDVRAGDVILTMQPPNPPAEHLGNGHVDGSASKTSRKKTATR
jgi:hypothetical protein